MPSILSRGCRLSLPPFFERDYCPDGKKSISAAGAATHRAVSLDAVDAAPATVSKAALCRASMYRAVPSIVGVTR